MKVLKLLLILLVLSQSNYKHNNYPHSRKRNVIANANVKEIKKGAKVNAPLDKDHYYNIVNYYEKGE